MIPNIKNRILYLYIYGCASLLLTALLCINDSAAIHAFAADNQAIITELKRDLPNDYAEYRLFVTPDESSVVSLAKQLNDQRLIYQTAVQWVYVSEYQMNGIDDEWHYPAEFLELSPGIPANPVPGRIAGDCEEQANTLVSLLRASGITADNVRVVLGEVSVDRDLIRGHVWVEIWENDDWLALDPSQGPAWNERFNRLVELKGMPFDYYVQHNYPITDISLYYNDKYYLDIRNGRGNAPASWYPDTSR